jgi:hypothetical protein
MTKQINRNGCLMAMRNRSDNVLGAECCIAAKKYFGIGRLDTSLHQALAFPIYQRQHHCLASIHGNAFS